MPVDVTLPQLGESTYEGTIGKWLKHPGDRIERFEPLVEIITDKVNVEMPAPYGGVLSAILIPEGQTVPVGTPIAVMETPEGAAERPAAVMPSTGAGVDIQQDLARLPGSGAGGRVTKEDVLKYVETRQAIGPGAPTAAVPPAPPAAAGLHPGDQLVKLTPLRRSIAQRMAQSKREIPHAYGVIEVDMTALVRWRDAHKEEWRSREGVNITYTAFFVRAAVEALRAFPLVNSSWSEDGIIVRQAINTGIGIALDDGLIVAVIKQADRKPLVQIAKELEALGRRAREGTLALDDVQGGTFTITNPGVFGSIWSMPIVVPGQAAILATDAIVKRPVAHDDAIVLREIMHLGLSFDHRIFDGAVADRFLSHIRQKLESAPAGDAAPNDF